MSVFTLSGTQPLGFAALVARRFVSSNSKLNEVVLRSVREDGIDEWAGESDPAARIESSRAADVSRLLTADGTEVFGPDALLTDFAASAPANLHPHVFGAGVVLDASSGDDGERATLLRKVSGVWATAVVAGTATDQREYEAAARAVHDELGQLSDRLRSRRFLTSSRTVTLADLALLGVALAHDGVISTLFKCNLTRLEDADGRPSHRLAPLLAFARDLFAAPEVQAVADGHGGPARAMQRHHWANYGLQLAGRAITPRHAGPDWLAPHSRFPLYVPPTVSTPSHPVLGVAGKASALEDPGAGAGGGAFERGQSSVRQWVTADGSSGLKAEPGRYTLVVAFNCPWCHRVATAWALKGLQGVVGLDVLFYRRHGERGWQYAPAAAPQCSAPSLSGDPVRFVPDLYARQGSSEKSVPLLFDNKTRTIVNNESAELLRMLNTEFDAFAARPHIDLTPSHLLPAIEQINAWVYPQVNNGAYRAGFASSQAAYDAAHDAFFEAFSRLDRHLSRTGPFLTGGTVTEADIRLFPTVFRFDPVYHLRFRLTKHRLDAFPHLAQWLQRVLDLPDVDTVSPLAHSRRGYFSRTGLGTVPIGPDNYAPPFPAPEDLRAHQDAIAAEAAAR